MASGRFKHLIDCSAGTLAVGVHKAVRFTDRRRAANFAGALMRRLGPLRKEHRLGRDNLRAAFPEKSDAEVEKILAGVWDNLGRLAVESAHLDQFGLKDIGRPAKSLITYPPQSKACTDRLARDGTPTIGFAAHLANWELPGVCAKLLGFNSAVLYRRPNLAAVSDLIVRIRAPLMGELIPTGLDAPMRLARLLQSGVHVGMLADQHYTKGVVVTFFGRRCKANPLAAMLARQTECPIHGMRVVRNEDGNSFWAEVTEEVPPVRDAAGDIDVAGTTQAITAVIEGWVREHPEQWLWVHRRWR
jgi:KDO2-lipid IV(A) lauroyltransferase